MGTRAFDIADFYQQLALLIKSNLPLPESLRQLARHFPKRDFQEAVARIAEETARGRDLSDALAAYPQFFRPLDRQLLAAGEKSNMLPEVLAEVAKLAHVKALVVAHLRDALWLPLLTLHVVLLVVFFLSLKILPIYEAIFVDFLGDGMHLPWLTRQVLSFGFVVRALRVPEVVLYGCFLVGSIVVSLPTRFSRRVLFSVMHWLPAAPRLTRALDLARLCNAWSVFIRNEMPLHGAIEASAELVESPRLAKGLRRVAGRIQGGVAPADALEDERTLDGLVGLTVRHVPGNELGRELEHLGRLYESRSTATIREVKTAWTVGATAVMAVLVGVVVIAMFLPLITIVHGMTG